MATLEDLERKSIADMSRREALEYLRLIRLSRRTPIKKTRTTKRKVKAEGPPELTKAQMDKLIAELGGNK